MMRASIGTMVVLGVVALVSARSAEAQQPSIDEQARILFMAGQTYYEQGEYELAQQQFERAYQLSPRPLLLMNAVNAAERAGHLAEAIAHLERYLEQEPDAANRATLDRRLDAMRRRLDRQATTDRDQEPGTTTSEPAPDARTTEGDASAPPEPSEPEERVRAPRHLGTPAIIAYSVGGAGLVTFAVFGPLTLAQDSSLESGCGATRTCSSGDLSKLRGFGITADVGMVVGLAGAITGTVLFLTSGRSAPHEDRSVSVSPWFGPQGSGATVQLVF